MIGVFKKKSGFISFFQDWEGRPLGLGSNRNGGRLLESKNACQCVNSLWNGCGIPGGAVQELSEGQKTCSNNACGTQQFLLKMCF